MKRVALAVAAIVGVAACGGDPAAETREPSTSTISSVPTTIEPPTTTMPIADLDINGGVDGAVAYAPGPWVDGGEDAVISGVLSLDGNCLYVGDLPAGARNTVIWPYTTRWQDDPPAVVQHDGSTIEVGQRVDAGGGYGDVDSLIERGYSEALTRRLDQCAEGELAWIQELSEVPGERTSSGQVLR